MSNACAKQFTVPFIPVSATMQLGFSRHPAESCIASASHRVRAGSAHLVTPTVQQSLHSLHQHQGSRNAAPNTSLMFSPICALGWLVQAPKGGRRFLMFFLPCLESQGCHFDPPSYLLSCFSAQPSSSVCHFSANGPFSRFSSRKLIFR